MQQGLLNVWIDHECRRISRFCERLDDKLCSGVCLEDAWESILHFLQRRMEKCLIPLVHAELQRFLETSFDLRSRADFMIWRLNFEEALTNLLRFHRTAVL